MADIKKIIEIAEDTLIPGTNIMLEYGDRVRVFTEADTSEIIKDFIETNWSKSPESAGKAVSLLKGLAFSDDEMAEKFIKDLDKLSNTLNAEDYE